MTKSLGMSGEDMAVEYLKEKGYKIVHRNFKTGFGEADIIAKYGDRLIFVEVKTRKGDLFGQPYEAVGPRKQEKLRAIALAFMKKAGKELPVRFDIISIISSDQKEEIIHIEGAF